MALTVYYVSDGLEARATDRPLVHIEGIGLLVEPEQEDVASDVEDRVDPSRQERQGERRDGRIHCAESVQPPRQEGGRLTLQDAEAKVGEKTRPDRDPNLQIVK